MSLAEVVTLRSEPRLSDIPGLLRNMAAKFESGDIEADSVLFVVHRPGDWPIVYGWGDNLGEIGMIGLLELAKSWVVQSNGGRST